jgi:hypothetical protein
MCQLMDGSMFVIKSSIKTDTNRVLDTDKLRCYTIGSLLIAPVVVLQQHTDARYSAKSDAPLCSSPSIGKLAQGSSPYPSQAHSECHCLIVLLLFF